MVARSASYQQYRRAPLCLASICCFSWCLPFWLGGTGGGFACSAGFDCLTLGTLVFQTSIARLHFIFGELSAHFIVVVGGGDGGILYILICQVQSQFCHPVNRCLCDLLLLLYGAFQSFIPQGPACQLLALIAWTRILLRKATCIWKCFPYVFFRQSVSGLIGRPLTQSWGDGLEVKEPSSRLHSFDSQPAHSSSQPSKIPVPGCLAPSSDLPGHCRHAVHKHTCRQTLTHKVKVNKPSKKFFDPFGVLPVNDGVRYLSLLSILGKPTLPTIVC